MIFNEAKDQISSLDSLIKIVFNLQKTMELVIIEEVSKNKNYTYYRYNYKKLRKNNFQQVMSIGALLVYKIREFLLDEQIYFSLGATDENGKLFEKQISQEELFNQKNIISSLDRHAVLFRDNLEHIESQEVGSLNQWPEILQLAFNGYGEGARVIEKNNDKYYGKSEADTDVYIRWTGGKKRIRNYYYSKELKYFNRGWLYEWYMEYINSSNQAEEKLQNSLINGSLSPLFYGKKMDAIPGTKGGDYEDKIHNKQVQAKYGNKKIISYYSILQNIKKIFNILVVLKASYNIESAAEKFSQLFTHDPSVPNRLNETYSNIINERLLKLFSDEILIKI